MASDNELIIKINGTAKNFLDELEKVKKKTSDVNDVLTSTAKGAAVAFAAFTATIAISTKAFADYETALVGVGKTTNITGDALKSMGKDFQKLATTIPVSTNELLGIAQAAGQLGVKGEDNLLKFTDTVAKLGVATDLAGAEAATSLARILNVTGENIQSIDKLGAVIVRMGNNFAASESEIVRVTTEVAKATGVFGVSSAQAVGLATAMRAMGVQAELGGSVLGRSFRAINTAIDKGGGSLQNLSAITGMTGEQLKKTFKEDATSVFQAFVEGLGRIDEAGGSSQQALATFGLKGDEILKILPILSKNSDQFALALGTASDELKKGTALENEAAAAFNTLNSETQLLKNNFENLKVSIGEKLAPQMRGLLSGVSDLLKGISGLDQETISNIASLLKWGAIITGVVTAITGFLFGAIQIAGIVAGITAAFIPATIAASGFWLALTGPIGIAVAGLAALTFGAVSLYQALSKAKAPETLNEIVSALDKLKKKKEDLNKVEFGREFDPARLGKNLEAIDKEISKLEELRQAKIRSSKDFGTGEMLVKPKAAGVFSDLIPNISGVTVPLAMESAPDTTAIDKEKKKQKQITTVVDIGTQARIAAAQRENEALSSLKESSDSGLLAQDMKLLQTKAQIEEEYAQARLIKNTQERELAIQNLALKHAEDSAKIQEFNLAEDALIATRSEEKAALDAEMRALTVEQQAQFTAEDRAALQMSIDSKSEAEKKYNQDKITKNIAVQNQFKQDELKHGTAMAEMKKFFASEEVQGFKSVSSDLAQMTNSRNSTLKGIGKAAAITNIGISTAEASMKAYAQLGPIFGTVAAAAMIAYGAERASSVAGLNEGGIVPSGFGSVSGKDSVPAMLTPNELVVPTKNFDEVIESVAASRSNSNVNNSSTNSIVIQGDFYGEETFIDKLAEKLYDAQQTRNVRLV